MGMERCVCVASSGKAEEVRGLFYFVLLIPLEVQVVCCLSRESRTELFPNLTSIRGDMTMVPCFTSRAVWRRYAAWSITVVVVSAWRRGADIQLAIIILAAGALVAKMCC